MKCALALPFFILLLSINLLIFDQEFYATEMPQYESYMEQQENLLYYFQGAELQKENYSEREILHLKDVRNLIWSSWILIFLLLIPIIYSSFKKKDLKKELYKGGIYTLVLTFLLGLALLSFSSSFTLFHELLFTNDLWLLPADSLLIQMFPQEFFIESTKQILLYSFIFSLFIIIVGYKVPGEKHGKRT